MKELIKAARLAPSGNNTQPSRYFIVNSPAIKEKLKDKKIFKQDFVYTAPAIIICCADYSVYKEKVGGWDDLNKNRATRDLSISSGFLVLRAVELGLGTCYVGWIEKEKIKEVLNIPRNYIVPYVVTVGYPAEQPEPTPRKSIDESLNF